ncbi:MAG: hypothetical protein JST92_17520 [Deltaproteobacteria bacterium]|nr:hypothetical protein [Deltaproteobacteria bacterium]
MANERVRPTGAQDESADATTSGPAAYTEEQVTEILRRTAQLERGRAVTKPALTLAEVENIAREAGLDPSLVRIAAQSLGTDKEKHGFGARVFGEPITRVFERVVDGEISLADHEKLIADLRAAGRGGGRGNFHPPQIASVGRTLTFASGFVEIDISPRNGKTLIRVKVTMTPLAGGLFGGLMCGSAVVTTPPLIAFAANGHFGIAGAVAGVLGLWSGIYTLARTIFTYNARKEYKGAEQLADRLAERLREEFAGREKR